MGIKGQLEEAEEEVLKENLANRMKTVSERRVNNEAVAKLAIICYVILISFGNTALEWLKGNEGLNPDVAIYFLSGIVLYLSFQFVQQVIGYFNLRMQMKAVKVDIKELEVEKGKKEIELMGMSASREEKRLDAKHRQDLQLRVPLMELANSQLMEFFSKDDIIELLKLPPSFINAVKQLDNQILRRSVSEHAMDEIREALASILSKHEDLDLSLRQQGALIDELVMRDSVQLVKYATLDTTIKQVNEKLHLTIERLDHLDQRVNGKLVKFPVKLDSNLTVKKEVVEATGEEKKREELKADEPPT